MSINKTPDELLNKKQNKIVGGRTSTAAKPDLTKTEMDVPKLETYDKSPGTPKRTLVPATSVIAETPEEEHCILSNGERRFGKNDFTYLKVIGKGSFGKVGSL